MFRFSMRTMMWTVTAAAVVCAVFFALPVVISMFILTGILLLLPPILIAGIVYGRGYGRAFCIGVVCTGGAMPIIMLYAGIAIMQIFGEISTFGADESLAVKIYFAVGYAFMAISGFLAVATRWVCVRANAKPEPKVETPTPFEKLPAVTPEEYSVLHSRVNVTLPNPLVDEDEDAIVLSRE